MDPAVIWLTLAEIAARPTTGPAWDNLVTYAEGNLTPDLSDDNNKAANETVAKAIVGLRLGDLELIQEARDNIEAAIGTQGGGSSGALYLGRRLRNYVTAARLIRLDELDPELEADFVAWLDPVRFEVFGSRSIHSTMLDRPNNWGTHALASYLAASVYLDDQAGIDEAVLAFRGWLGDVEAYHDFTFKDPYCWHTDPDDPGSYVGINPPGGPLDGAIPDDMRRCEDDFDPCCPEDFAEGGYPCDNYVRGALDGTIYSAELLERLGYPAFGWSSEAIRRAAVFMDAQDGADCDPPFPGNDEYQPWALNYAYPALELETQDGAEPGRGNGFSDVVRRTCRSDLDSDGVVGTIDFRTMLGAWQHDDQAIVRFLALLGDLGGCP